MVTQQPLGAELGLKPRLSDTSYSMPCPFPLYNTGTVTVMGHRLPFTLGH